MSTFRKPNPSSHHSQPRQHSPSSLVLESFLENSTDLVGCPFVVVEDCPSQSGLPVIRELVHRAAKTSQNVVVCTATIDPIKLLASSHPHHDQSNQSRCRTVDLVSFEDHLPTQLPGERVQLSGDRIQTLINELAARDAEVPTTVVIDSVPECVRLWTLHESFRLFRRILQLLPNARSRLVVLVSPHLHTPSSLSSLDPTQVLRSLAISSSHLHLKIHPTCLLDHLVNAFGLPFPFPSSHQPGTHYDLRLFPLLDELAAACDPYVRQQDGPVPVPEALLVAPDPTVSSLGTCVVEWTSKNLSACNARPSASVRARPATKSASTGNTRLASIQHGLEALRLEPASELRLAFRLSPVPLSAVLTQKTHTLTAVSDQDPTRKADPLEGQLTFNLSLTDKQRAAREAVALPFLPRRAEDGTVIEAPGDIYDGSFQDPESRHKSGMILYEPDSADDMDDEEPDDEL